MADRFEDQVATTIEEIRSNAMTWQSLDAEERVRRIRQHLLDRAGTYGKSPQVFARGILAAVPEPEAGRERSAAQRPPAEGAGARAQDPPLRRAGSAVDQIMDLVHELTEAEVSQLLDRLRGLEIIPPPSSTPPPQAVQVEVSDDALRALAAGLGIRTMDELPRRNDLEPRQQAPRALPDIESELAGKGIRRFELTPDRLVFALGHLADAVAEWVKENEDPPQGLGETIRTQRLHREKVAPAEKLIMFLAGRESQGVLRDGLRNYFEPYRALAAKFTDFVWKFVRLASLVSPTRIESDLLPTKSMWGDSSKQLWAKYSERFRDLSGKGFGRDFESTRIWLLKEWLA